MKTFEEKNKDIFGVLFESVAEGIIVVNKKQIIVASNASANKLFRYKPGELKGQHLNVLVPKTSNTPHENYAGHFVKYGDSRQMGHGRDLYGLRKDNTKFPVEIGLNPFEIDGDKYVMAMVIDISVRKEHQRQILELNNALERKIEQRTNELRSTVLDLKEEINRRHKAESKIKASLEKERELNNLKTKFLSMVSHEFKTPLSGILTSATLAGKYPKEDQQPKREKHLKTIKAKVKYLNSILSDFLSLERMETGKVDYKFTKFPLSRVINTVVYEANMLLKDGQKINYPDNIDEIELYFDEKILQLSLTNLLNNSIKYSPEGKEISITANNRENNFILHITDEGIGIPEQEKKHIFRRYFRAENAVLQEGTGIGLNIIKNHLENLNAKLKFESQLGKGSTFSIEIPKQQPQEEQ